MRREWQMSTILAVEIDSPPVWLLGISFYHNPMDILVQVPLWRDWMREAAAKALETLIPKDNERRVYPPEVYAHHIEFRSPLLAREMPYLKIPVAEEEKSRPVAA